MNIFVDLDGTLIDARWRLYQLFCDASGRTGLSFSRYWQLKRDARTNEWILTRLLGSDHRSVSNFTDKWFRLVETRKYLALDRPFHFAKSVLRDLSRNNQITIITARRNEYAARQQIYRMGFDPFVADVLATGATDSKAGRLSQSKISIGLGDFVVGDTEADIQLASSLGVRSASVLSGVRSRRCLASYRPDFIFPDLRAFRDRVVQGYWCEEADPPPSR